MKEEHKEDAKRIGHNILNLIIEHEIEQKDLAAALGVSEATVSSWVNGNRIPRMGTVTKISKYFGVPRSVVLGDKDPYVTTFNGFSTETTRAFMSDKVDEEFKKRILEIVNENNQKEESVQISPDEQQLLTDYRKLNNLGKNKAREDVEDLTMLQAITEPFRKKCLISLVFAQKCMVLL